MSKVKFNLVGNTFTHLTNGNKGYSVHGKESKYIEWVDGGWRRTLFTLIILLMMVFMMIERR